jgi:hypothetical protein
MDGQAIYEGRAQTKLESYRYAFVFVKKVNLVFFSCKFYQDVQCPILNIQKP